MKFPLMILTNADKMVKENRINTENVLSSPMLKIFGRNHETIRTIGIEAITIPESPNKEVLNVSFDLSTSALCKSNVRNRETDPFAASIKIST